MASSSLATSPSSRAQTPLMGVRTNPNRTRSPSVTSEGFRTPRPPSSVAAMGAASSTTTTMLMGRGGEGGAGESDEETVLGERTPLLTRPAANAPRHEETFLKGPLRSRDLVERDMTGTVVSLSTSSGNSGGGGGGGGLGGGGRQSLTESLETIREKGVWFWLRCFKILVLFAVTVTSCAFLVKQEELGETLHEIVAITSYRTMYSGGYDDSYPFMEVRVMGPFYERNTTTHINNGSSSNSSYAMVYVTPSEPTNNTGWGIGVNRTALYYGDMVESSHQFKCAGPSHCNLSLKVTGSTEDDLSVPLVYSVHKVSSQIENQTIYAAVILVFVYVLIIFELVHRTLAALLGALAALAVLSAINERPTTDTIIGWMEMETLMLLFGMMIIVGVVAETGIFDYAAFKACVFSRRRVWPLVTLLCLFSAVVSAFLDNVTTILLMAPVTIRLCEVLNLEPRVILIAEVLFSNIGGTATAIGDPPNVIIIGSLEREGVTFTVFTGHLVVGIIFVTIAAYLFLRLYYRNMDHLNNPDPPHIADLRHEIEMWRRAASRQVVVTREETLMRALFLQKAATLETQLNRLLHRQRRAEARDLNEQFRQLERDFQIRDGVLLVKCGFVLLVVLIFFFMYSFVTDIHVGLGWIAVLGALWLLVLADVSDVDCILHKVEWSTLLFFAALFILMEALAQLGLMEWIGEQMKDLIVLVADDYRMTAAVVIIVWISAIASSCIDNIPFTTAMIPVLKQLNDDPAVNLDLLPMVVALAFGACLGGNGTLIGASANVVCAGIAEQHGYIINFKQFFKVGFPMVLVTTTVATVYLLICHSWIKWNSL